MPVFEYKAINQSGKEVKGTLDSESIRIARQKLRSQGIFPTDIKEGRISAKEEQGDIKKMFSSSRVTSKTLSVSTRQLATLLASGVPLVDSMQGISEQTDSLVLKKTAVDIREKVQEGSSLSKALSLYPKIFPKLYINMVASGEASGTLDTVFENLADYLDQQLEMKRKIVSSLFYPALMLIFCVLVVVGLLAFVVPTIVDIFKKNNAVLPLPTRILITISGLLTSYWYLLILSFVGIFFLIRAYYKSPNGRKKMDSLVIKLPVIGNLYKKIYTARISQTLGTLLQSGVGLLAAIEIVRNIASNVHVIKALEEAKDGVREGRSLARELSKSGLFPSMLPQMVAVGEKSGKLDSMLVKAGQAYERDVNATLSGLTSLIEPLMIISVGIVVLGIVISILLPMTSLMDAIQR